MLIRREKAMKFERKNDNQKTAKTRINTTFLALGGGGGGGSF